MNISYYTSQSKTSKYNKFKAKKDKEKEKQNEAKSTGKHY